MAAILFFVFSVRYVRLSVGASIFRILFCLYRFFFSISISGLPWRVFSLSLSLSIFFRIIFNAWRVGDGDVITHRRRRRRWRRHLSRNFTHRPFSMRYFRFIYISKAFVEKIPKRKCRQKAVDGTAAALSSSRRVASCRYVALPIMRKLRD